MSLWQFVLVGLGGLIAGALLLIVIGEVSSELRGEI